MSEALLKDDRVLVQLAHDVGEETVPILLASFQKEILTSRQTIRDCLDTGDFALMETTAHAFKSVSASFGALRLSEACLAIELAAKERANAQQLKTLVDGLEPVVNATVDVFDF